MFDNFTDEQLQKELERRQKIKDESEKPQQHESINIGPLRKICQSYIDDVQKDGYADDDYVHYIFEVAMGAVFGEDVWQWINAKQE